MRGLGPRRLAAVSAFALMVVGAAIGAGTHASSAVRFRADAVIVVNGDPAGADRASRRARSRLLTDAVRLPAVAAAAQRRGIIGTPKELAAKITVSEDPARGLVVVSGRDRTPAAATAVANAFAQAAVAFTQDAGTPGVGDLVAADFEQGVGTWRSSGSVFGFGPATYAIASGEARYNDAALRVTCLQAAPCATWLWVDNSFWRRERYVASAWVKAPEGDRRVRLVLGAVGDNASGAWVPAGSTWTRVRVAWRPSATVSAAQLAVVSRGERASPVDVDGVTLWSAEAVGRPLDDAAVAGLERRVFARRPGMTVFPARAISSSSGSTTALWAAVGGAAGLLVAAAGIGAAFAAGRRRAPS